MNGEDKVVVWRAWAKKCDEKRYPKCGGGKMAGGGGMKHERRAFLVGKATASKDLAPDHIRIRIRVTPA